MSEEVSFTAKLIDEVSRSARNIRKSVGGIGQEFKGVGKSANLGGAQEGVDGLAGSLKGLAAALGVAAVAAKGLDLAKQFTGAATEALAFKDATVGGLAVIMRSQKDAQATFSDTLALSERLGVDFRQTMTGVQGLLAGGFDASGARELVTSMADLKSVMPTAKLDSMLLAIKQINAAGHLQGDELNQLGEAGLDAKLVYAQLSKTLGKTVPEIVKMKEAGKLDADTTITAIKGAIANLTGKPLGKAAEDAANSFSGLIDQIKRLPTTALDEFANSFNASGVTSELKSVWESIKPGSELFGSVVSTMGSAFEMIVSAVKVAKPIVSAFFDGFMGPIGDVLVPLKKIGPGIGEAFANPAFIDAAKELGTQIGKIAAGAGVLIAGIIRIIPPVVEAIAWFSRFSSAIANVGGTITTAMVSLNVAALGIARDFIVGFANGITNMAGIVIQAVTGLGASVIAAVKAVLGIASPSKVMAEFGFNTAQGFSQGLTAGQGGVTRAGASMGSSVAMPATRGADSAFSSVGMGSATTNNSGGNSFSISVQVTAPTESSPEQFGAGVARGMRSEFESMFASIQPV